MPIQNGAYQTAQKKATTARILLYGTDGSGKTYTALKLMRHLVGGGDILVVDTEQVGEDAPRSGQYDEFMHYVDPLPLSHLLAHPAQAYTIYCDRVQAAIESGAEAVILDSWSDEAIAYMTMAKAIGDDKSYYHTVKPMRIRLCEAIKNAPCHIIICQRARERGVWQDGGDGQKARIIRMAEQPEGSDAIGYAINLRLAMESLTARVVKTIYSDFLPEGAEFDVRAEWDTFADKIVSALDDGAITRERFKLELLHLGYPQSTWTQLWRDVPELGEWSPERHHEMLDMVRQNGQPA